MRKLIVRIFNLIYLAGTAIAIWAFVTKPVINTSVGASMSSDQVADQLMKMFESSSGSSEDSSEKSGYKLTYKDSSSEEVGKVTKEDIKDAFPNGFSIKVGIKIEAKDAFDLNNKTLLTKSVAKSIDEALSSVLSTATDGLHSLIKTLTEKFAKEELRKQINEQIASYFAGASEVSDTEVQKVYDNVYNTINSDGEVTVENLADAIVGKQNEDGTYPEGTLLYLLEEKKKETGTGMIYAVADPQPTQEELEADIAKEEAERIYYVEHEIVNPETKEVTKEYVRPTAYNLDTKYYIEKYDATSVSGDDIADKLATSLDSIPGLVETKYTASSPTATEFNATVVSSKHYVYNGANEMFVFGGVYSESAQYFTIEEPVIQPQKEAIDAEIAVGHGLRTHVVATEGGYVYPTEYKSDAHYMKLSVVESLTEEDYYNTAASNKYEVKVSDETYEFAKKYDSSAEYFVEQRIVNDVDTALAKLIESMLGDDSSSGENNKAHLRGEGSSSNSSKDELEEKLKQYIYSFLPMDQIYGATEKADQYATYVVLGLIGLCIFPWALFALVTFIRTLRTKKCWTKPWIVFFFAFFQLIFGIVLTYGIKYALPLIAKYVPQVAEFLESSQLALELKTGCLIPSFVYVGFIVLTIPYIIVCHGVKVQYKLEKRAQAVAYYEARQNRQ